MSNPGSMRVPTVERLLNLSAFLLSERRPQTLRTIVEKVEGYDPRKDYESNRRMFIRDRKALAGLDILIKIEKNIFCGFCLNILFDVFLYHTPQK